MQSNTTVFLLPFSGASKYSYAPLQQFVPDHVTFVPVEMPGRGSRMREPLLRDLHQMADDAFSQIQSQLKAPYILYGHSLGTNLAYLIALKIRTLGLPAPERIVLSGNGGASVPPEKPFRHLMSPADFKAKLNEYGGSPREVLENDQLMEIFGPILRADFEAIETYQYEPVEPLDIPVTVLYGKDESVTPEEAEKWQEETKQPIRVREFEGTHFFIFDHPQEIVREILGNVS